MLNLLNYFKAKGQHHESNLAGSTRTITSREVEEVKKQLEIPSKLWGHLSGKYPQLTRQTVNDFKKSYNELREKSGGKEVTLIAKKPRGRPTLLPEELMAKTIDVVSSLLLRGAPVSSAVIRAVAKGTITSNDRSLLVENGGALSLNKDWARQILYRMETRGEKLVRQSDGHDCQSTSCSRYT